MPEKSAIYFAFSIATKRGTEVGGLGHLLSEMNAAGITLQSLSGFVSEQRTNLFCVPASVDKFRAFAKTRKLRLTEKTAMKLAGDGRLVMNLLHRWAISGDILPAFTISRQTGLVYLPAQRH